MSTADNSNPPLHADLRGDDGPVVILLHGLGGSGAVWSTIAERLSRHCRVLAYDLPGHAGSLGIAGSGPAKTAMREVLADMDRRNIASAHIAGHSLGGAVAALIALSAPERVSSLTLVAPGGMGEEINGPLLRRFGAATSPDEIGACLKLMSGPQAVIDPQAVSAHMAMRAVPGQIERLAEIAAAITRDDRQGVIPAASLAALTMPVTVVWGTKDDVLPFAQTQGLPPSFKLVEIEGAGHMLVDEAPETVFSAIADMAEA
jgi:pimeloyl-ACP methyl ester carboxylesterase